MSPAAAYLREVPAALRAPFQAPAVAFLVVTWLLGCVSLALYGLHPYVTLGTALIVLWCLSVYANSVAVRTVENEVEPFGWDVSDDWLRFVIAPTLRTVGLLAAAAAAIYAAWRWISPVAAIACAVAAALWLPMAWLRAATTENFVAAFSPAVPRSIALAAAAYLPTVAALELLVAAPAVLFVAEPLPAFIPLVVAVPYAFIAGARLLALVYDTHADQLAWFGEGDRYYTPIR